MDYERKMQEFRSALCEIYCLCDEPEGEMTQHELTGRIMDIIGRVNPAPKTDAEVEAYLREQEVSAPKAVWTTNELAEDAAAIEKAREEDRRAILERLDAAFNDPPKHADDVMPYVAKREGD